MTCSIDHRRVLKQYSQHRAVPGRIVGTRPTVSRNRTGRRGPGRFLFGGHSVPVHVCLLLFVALVLVLVLPGRSRVVPPLERGVVVAAEPPIDVLQCLEELRAVVKGPHEAGVCHGASDLTEDGPEEVGGGGERDHAPVTPARPPDHYAVRRRERGGNCTVGVLQTRRCSEGQDMCGCGELLHTFVGRTDRVVAVIAWKKRGGNSIVVLRDDPRLELRPKEDLCACAGAECLVEPLDGAVSGAHICDDRNANGDR